METKAITWPLKKPNKDLSQTINNNNNKKKSGTIECPYQTLLHWTHPINLTPSDIHSLCIRTLPSNYPPSQSIHKYYFSTFHLAFSLSTLVTACDTSRIDVPPPPALCKWVQPRIYDQNRTARRNGNEIYLTGNSPIKRFHIIAIIV